MANPVSKSPQPGDRTPESSKKPPYDICVRGQVPSDLVNRISELHAKTILMTRTSISEIQDGQANSGEEKVRNSLPPAPTRKSVRKNEKAQE